VILPLLAGTTLGAGSGFADADDSDDMEDANDDDIGVAAEAVA
jgi:hypothetical protein